MPRLKPKAGPVSSDDRWWQEQADAWQRDALARTRASAEGWLKALAAMTGLTVLVGIVKGQDQIDQLSSSYDIVVGLLLLLAVGLAGLAIERGHAAAYGTPLPTWTGFAAFRARDRADLADVVSKLRVSRRLAVGGFVALLVAIGLTWYGPHPDAESIVVPTPSGELCLPGSLADGVALHIDAAQGGTVRSVKKCPAR
jgi:uncharacterized membrane protein